MLKRSDVRIIDGHCHLSSSRCIPEAFFRGVAANTVAKIRYQGVPAEVESVTNMLIAQSEDHEGDALIAQMDGAGIEQTVLLAPDFTHVFNSDYSITEIAEQHHKVIQKHPGRFKVLMGVDPRWGQEGYDLFERCITDFGFDGLKLYPPCGYSPSDESLYPLFEICKQHQLPVLLHTGPTSPTLRFSYASPNLIDKAALDFPDVNFILAHAGANNVEEGRLMCLYRPNVYLDISGFPSSTSPGGWRQSLAELFKAGINHKVIFGTDWPAFYVREGLDVMLADLFADDGPMKVLNSKDLQAVMRGNMARLLKLE